MIAQFRQILRLRRHKRGDTGKPRAVHEGDAGMSFGGETGSGFGHERTFPLRQNDVARICPCGCQNAVERFHRLPLSGCSGQRSATASEDVVHRPRLGRVERIGQDRKCRPATMKMPRNTVSTTTRPIAVAPTSTMRPSDVLIPTAATGNQKRPAAQRPDPVRQELRDQTEGIQCRQNQKSNHEQRHQRQDGPSDALRKDRSGG